MEEIRHVTLADVLRARDERAARQAALLRRHAVPLISFTMNIAGSIKCDALIRRAFDEGVRRIGVHLQCRGWEALAFEQSVQFAGCEALWAVRAEADELKQAMRSIEEADALGRLFDMDVIAPDGRHLSRGAERPCLICGGCARVCARSRAHPPEALLEAAHGVIRRHFQDGHVRRIGELAQKALLYETVVTPKPGLVDCENSGAHRDMDLFSFVNSACALRSYFETCARLGLADADMAQLQHAGMLAQADMMQAAGANTHKGAIFSLGLLCYAAGSCGEGAQREAVCQKAADIGRHFLGQMTDGAQARTAGERQYAQYGLTGARGEAASGFRTVRQTALPAFERALEKGDVNAAGVETLLWLIACVQDSNLIRRGGPEGLRWAMEQARAFLGRAYGPEEVRALNQRFVKRNLSPGGSADLLAVTFFLAFLDRRSD